MIADKGSSAAKKILASRETVKTNSINAIPSPTHMAMVELAKQGALKYVVSQNTDGLHRRSGIPPANISELHGNGNLEICVECGKQYMRDYRVIGKKAKGPHTMTLQEAAQQRRKHKGKVRHYTGRLCTVDGCQGRLMNTIVAFGESMPAHGKLKRALEHSKQMDLCVALGSSLRVKPANKIPNDAGLDSKKHLVIVNLQKTPLDCRADFVIHAKCDDVMVALCEQLGYKIPIFTLTRYASVSRKQLTGTAFHEVTIRGVDSDGTPFHIFTAVNASTGDKDTKLERKTPDEGGDDGVCHTFVVPQDATVELTCEFRGHYKEPSLQVTSIPSEVETPGDNHLRFTYTPKPADDGWTLEMSRPLHNVGEISGIMQTIHKEEVSKA